MGAGILPTTIHHGKLYFLFGKENKFADTPGWSDFGGGTDNNETFLQTAIREGGEELTGFLGSDSHLRSLLQQGVFPLDLFNEKHKYRMHIFSYPYNEFLPWYYNNNQSFLQPRLSPHLIQTVKIFEKAEIKWICEDELLKMRSQFRSYFQQMIDKILQNKKDIYHFIQKHSSFSSPSLSPFHSSIKRKTKKRVNNKHRKTQKRKKGKHGIQKQKRIQSQKTKRKNIF